MHSKEEWAVRLGQGAALAVARQHAVGVGVRLPELSAACMPPPPPPPPPPHPCSPASVLPCSDEEVRELHPQHTQASVRALLPRLRYFDQGTCIVHHLFGGEVCELVR